jgi:hypothetical protein
LKKNKNDRVYPGSLFTEWRMVTPDDPIYFIDRVYSPYKPKSEMQTDYELKISQIINET